jgi:membrane protease subunit HflC
MKRDSLLLILILFFIIAFSMVTFTVDEKETVVITQMGKPVRTVKDPGLYFKLPYPVQTVHVFDDRILEYDSTPTEIITKDKKNLVIDNYASWKIIDPLKFMQTVATEAGAQSRLDDIIYSELRVELGSRDLLDAVANSRAKIMTVVTTKCHQKALEYGIDIVDVRVKRADLPAENEKYVFERMKAERQRIASRYRSEGYGESTKIKAETDRDKTKILADAYQKAQDIRGEGDAKALKIYADAYQRDPAFYDFTRSLEAYEKGLMDKTVVILSTKSELFKYLEGAVSSK